MSGNGEPDMEREWHDANNQYLAAALHWLRLRLAAAAVDVPREPTPPEASAAAVTADEDVAAAERAMLAHEQAERVPALVSIGRMFALSRFERDMLLLCCAVELDPGVPALCAAAQGDAAMAFPTFALGLTTFADPTWDALGPDGALRSHRLIEVASDGRPLTVSALRVDEQIVNAVKGLLHHDEQLALHVAGYVEAGPTPLPPSQQAVVDAVVAQMRTLPADRQPLVHLTGVDLESKLLVAAHIADRGRPPRFLARVPLSSLPSHPAELLEVSRLLDREARLLPQAVYIDAFDEVDGSSGPDGHVALLKRLLPRLGGPVFLDTRDVVPRLDVPAVTIAVGSPSMVEQDEEWSAALPELSAEQRRELTGQFNLSAPLIRRIGAAAVASAGDGPRARDVWSSCLAATRPGLERLADRVEPKATWDDLVLPDDARSILHAVVDQVRQRGRVYGDWGMAARLNRGLGTAVLFSGESGTGKTMAAEVVASTLRLNLYRVDLSQVVSKYIGETEKNLARVFDAAGLGGTVLFFDEADALFGKRSEVKDSHDRYANIEVNYLLQRMETYSGLAILATNLRSALDRAFSRRLRFTVTFPFPGPESRRAIWARAFPPTVPTASLDFDRLARFALTGGSIANVALNAMFMAAAAPDREVTMQLVLQAARLEHRKLQLSVPDSEFEWSPLPAPSVEDRVA